MYNSNYGSYGQNPGQAPGPPPAYGQNSGPPHTSSAQPSSSIYTNPGQFPQAPMSSQNMYGMNPIMSMSNNSAMPHGAMAATGGNNNMGTLYQTPYNVSSYGSGTNIIPSTAPSHQAAYMTAGGNSQQYGMSPQNLNSQAQPRMQPPSSSQSIPLGQRASSYGGAIHNTPPHPSVPQSQYAAPLPTSSSLPQPSDHTAMQPQNLQISSNPSSVGLQTPQTPSFPNSSGVTPSVVPLFSPEFVKQGQERVSTLLAINAELLQEVNRISDGPIDGSSSEPLSVKARTEAMQRLMDNLRWLAAMADGNKRQPSQVPPPTILTPPTFASAQTMATLQSLYAKLQGLFPSQSSTQGLQSQRRTPQMSNIHIGQQQSSQTTPRASSQPQPQSHQQQFPQQKMPYHQGIDSIGSYVTNVPTMASDGPGGNLVGGTDHQNVV